MRRRRIRAGHDQARPRLAFENQRQHRIYEPIDGYAVRIVAKTADEQHGQRLAPTRMKVVARGVNSGSQAIADPRGELGKEREEVVAIGGCAHLYLVEARDRAELVAQGAQILDASFEFVHHSGPMSEAAAD